MLANVQRALFSTNEASRHATKHYGDPSEPIFYESDFDVTSIKELEFVRSPFYDLGKSR